MDAPTGPWTASQDPATANHMRDLVLGHKSEGHGYHATVQMLVDAAIEACDLFTRHPRQFYAFMTALEGEIRTGILVAGELYGMPPEHVEMEAKSVRNIIAADCAP